MSSSPRGSMRRRRPPADKLARRPRLRRRSSAVRPQARHLPVRLRRSVPLRLLRRSHRRPARLRVRPGCLLRRPPLRPVPWRRPPRRRWVRRARPPSRPVLPFRALRSHRRSRLRRPRRAPRSERPRVRQWRLPVLRWRLPRRRARRREELRPLRVVSADRRRPRWRRLPRARRPARMPAP